MVNSSSAIGYASLAFRFYGVVPREFFGMELDRLHMALSTARRGFGFCPMWTPKLSAPVALIGEEISLR